MMGIPFIQTLNQLLAENPVATGEVPFYDSETRDWHSRLIVASDLASGIIAPARLGTGSPDHTKVLYGDSSWDTLPTVDLSMTADRVVDAIEGDLASLDSTGNLADSGISSGSVLISTTLADLFTRLGTDAGGSNLSNLGTITANEFIGVLGEYTVTTDTTNGLLLISNGADTLALGLSGGIHAHNLYWGRVGTFDPTDPDNTFTFRVDDANMTNGRFQGDGSALSGLPIPTLADVLGAGNDAGGNDLTNVNDLFVHGNLNGLTDLRIAGDFGTIGTLSIADTKFTVAADGTLDSLVADNHHIVTGTSTPVGNDFYLSLGWSGNVAKFYAVQQGVAGVPISVASPLLVGTQTWDTVSALQVNGITTFSTALAVTSGGTGLATIASGKLFYASANDTLAPLTLGTGLSITTGTLNAAVTSPGGSSGQLQYNNSGAFGGISAVNSAVLVTNGSGVASWSTTLPAVSGTSLTGLTKSQVGLGSVENTALSTWTGSTSLTTLGTVTTAGNVALLNAANTFTHTSGQTFAGPLACTSTSPSSFSGPLTAAGVTTIIVDDATSNSFTDVLKLVHTNSGGNGSNGIGAGLLFRAENGGGIVTDAARISGGLDGAGAGNEQGILRFFVRKSGALAEYARLNTDGALALGGAFSPSGSNTVLDIRYVSAELRFRNTGDPGGASWAANQNAIWLGLYNPSASTWGIVPAGVTRGIFAYDNNGVIGSLVPAAIGASSPSWRNKLDDGSGNSSFAGTLSVDSTIAPKSYTVATLPTPGTARRIAYASNARNAGEGSGAGTGSIVVDDGTVWKIPGIPGAVSA